MGIIGMVKGAVGCSQNTNRCILAMVLIGGNRYFRQRFSDLNKRKEFLDRLELILYNYRCRIGRIIFENCVNGKCQIMRKI